MLGAAVALAVVQLVLRGWALFTSWFFQDDISLLMDARGSRFDLGYLLEPWNNHLLPSARALTWLVAEVGPMSWGVAVTSTLVIQALTSAAAIWMLVTLFGRRPGILVPLSLYLFTSLTVPAMMWWTACLNQLPIQLGFFIAIGSAVRYLRGDGLRWAFLTYAGVAIGLLADVKALVILLVVGYLALAYFSSGGPVQRVWSAVRSYWPGLVISLPVVAVYVVYYTGHVQQPFVMATPGAAGRAADAMLGTAFPAGAVGGPWTWAQTNGYAAPPDWAVHLAWVLIVLVVLYGALRRTRTLRAWGLLAAYVGLLYGLVATSRVEAFGATIGLEYRYLTDAACVLALAVGLAFLEFPGAVGSSEARSRPLLTVAMPRSVVVGLTAVVALSGVASMLTYVSWWHRNDQVQVYLDNLRSDARSLGAVDVANTPVPETVVSGLLAPDNLVRPLSRLVTDRLSFPTWSPELGIVTDQGNIRRALIEESVVSKPGRRKNCGWYVGRLGRTIPLTADALPWTWWIRIAYLAPRDSPVVVTAGDSRVDAEILAGANSLYVKIEGSFDEVRIDGLDDGAVMCVDTIEVGNPIPGGQFE